MIDHNVLRKSCIKNKINPIPEFFAFIPFAQTKYNDMPIKTYSIVHTGPKTQFGGLNQGLSSPEYQPETELEVNREPIKPADRQIKTEMTSL